jgi:hypothetical protein
MSVSQDRWRRLTDQAVRQHGLLVRPQLTDVLTKGEIQARARTGIIEPVARGVYRIAGCPHTFRQRVLASCLSIGPLVVASHATAARLWDFEAFRKQNRVHLSVPPHRRGTRRALDARVHRVPLSHADVTVRYGVPVTTAIRTLGDLASHVPAEVLGHSVDEALRRRLILPHQLEALSADWYHRPGAPAIHALAVARGGGVGESDWEDRVYGWLIAAGLPPPVRQHPVQLPDGPIRLDLAYPDHLVGIEFEGWTWHGGRQRFDADRVRASELTLAGWRIVWVTSAQRAADVIARVRRALLPNQAS